MIIQNLTEEDLSMKYWDYFCALESDLKLLSRYVDFSEDNLNTYSIELTRLLLSSCSEIDVILRHICKKLSGNSKADNINKYYNELIKDLPNIFCESVIIGSNFNSIKPLEKWTAERSPNWWKMRNQVEHERNKHYQDANLKNVLDSMSALFITVHYYYKLVLTQAMMDHRGNQFSWKDLTQVLNSDVKLLKFEADYYHRSLAL